MSSACPEPDAGAAGAPSLLVIVQARLSSSRLPGKVLLEAAGKSLLGHLLARVGRCRHPHTLVVATTTQPADARVAAEAERHGARVFRGSEVDVLERFAGALAAHPAQIVVRLTADNPLLDPREIDRVIGEFVARRGGPDELDYATNHAPATGRSPLGLDVEVFSAEALQRAAREAREPADREHVTAYLYRVPGRFRVLRTAYPAPEHARYRLTVDTPEDLVVVRALLEALGPDADIADVARHLDAHPELAGVNASVVQRGAESEQELRRRRAAGRLLIGRADASAAAGYGHVMRVGALLEAWTELGGRALLVGHGVRGSVAARLRAAGVELAEPDAAEPRAEAAALVHMARTRGAAAIALDGYGFDASYQRQLGASFPLLALDDLASFAPIADVVVNPNLDFDAGRYGALRAGQRVLAGGPYVLLRRGLRERLGARAAARAGAARQRLVLAFGGSDPHGLTEPVLDALLEAAPGVEVSVVLGPGVAVERRACLTSRARSAARAHVIVDPPELGALLVGADAVICAAGVTVWEALALGVPTVLVTLADNQRVVSGPVVARGAALDAGWGSHETPRRAAQLARQLLIDPALGARLSDAGRGAIDGRGAWRVVDALLDVLDRAGGAP